MTTADQKGQLFLRQFLQSRQGIFAFILSLVLNRADAEDVFQEVSGVMWDKFDADAPPEDFRAWGCRIAYYKVLDFRKKQGRSKVTINQAMFEGVAESLADGATLARLDERQTALDECLQRLPTADRDLLTRRYQDGATTQSTAEDVGRSVDAVYKALQRIRAKLADCVTSRMGGERS